MLRLLQKREFKLEAAPREIGEQISHHLSPGSAHLRPPQTSAHLRYFLFPVNILSLSPQEAELRSAQRSVGLRPLHLTPAQEMAGEPAERVELLAI